MPRAALASLLLATAAHAGPPLALTALTEAEADNGWECRVRNAGGELVFSEDHGSPRLLVRVDGQLAAVTMTQGAIPQRVPRVGDKETRGYTDGDVTVRFDFVVTWVAPEAVREARPWDENIRADVTVTVVKGTARSVHRGYRAVCVR